MAVREAIQESGTYFRTYEAGRTDLFYTGTDGPAHLRVGDLVIVEADRGRDLGKIVNDTITHVQIEEWQQAIKLDQSSR